MAEGLGINKESIQRTIKSKWFLPALGIGGVVVVLLIVMSKNAGGSTASTGEEYPGQIYDPETNAPIGSPETDLTGLEKYLADLFGEYAGSQNTTSQQQQDAINSYLEQQAKANQDYLDQMSRTIQSQLDSNAAAIDSGLSGLYGQVPYSDPYAGIYGDNSSSMTEMADSFYGMDTPYSEVPMNEMSTITVNPIMEPVMKSGQGATDDRGMFTPETKTGAGADVKGAPATVNAKDNKAGYGTTPIVTGKDFTPTPVKAPNVQPAQTAPKAQPAPVKQPIPVASQPKYTPPPAQQPAKTPAPAPKAQPKAQPKPAPSKGKK